MASEKKIPVTHHIRAWRKRHKMTMLQLAEPAGLTAGFISQLELGRSHYTQTSLEAIAAVFKVEPWQLLAGPPGEAIKVAPVVTVRPAPASANFNELKLAASDSVPAPAREAVDINIAVTVTVDKRFT